MYLFQDIYIYNKEKRNKYKSFIELIINKAKRLLIPYLVSGVVFMIPVQMLFNVYEDKQSFLERVVNGILIAKNPAHLWYLLMLFNLFLIFYFIEKFIDMKKYIVNFIIFFVIGIISVKIKNIYQISSALKYIIYFYMGYTTYKFIENKKSIKISKKLILFVHFILFNINFFIIKRFDHIIFIKIIEIGISEIIAIFGVLWIFIYVFEFEIDNNISRVLNDNKIYRLVNRYNFCIYLVHQPIMLSIISVVKEINMNPFVLYSVLFILTLLFSILISYIIEKIVNLWKDKRCYLYRKQLSK